MSDGTSAPRAPSRRAEIRRQLRQARRLRVLTLIVVTAVLVGGVPLVFAIRAATRDPVFTILDSLALPPWAAVSHEDGADDGNRWCIKKCMQRERTWISERDPEQTNEAYVAALREAGWRPWSAPGCPVEGIDGFDSCWQYDEYVLDLWVRPPVCDPWAERNGTSGTSPTADAASPPAASGGAGLAVSGCPGARATAKVYERVAYHPGRI